MNIKLSTTDNIGITTTFEFRNELQSEDDIAQFLVQSLVFLERAGADISCLPEELQDQVDLYYETNDLE